MTELPHARRHLDIVVTGQARLDAHRANDALHRVDPELEGDVA
ncbi:MAG: hypothetical protein WCB63_17830 [Polyangiales bacterium]